MSGACANDDSQELARAGYRQELDRSLGSFSAFAAGFSYLSILTGVFQNFHLGYKEGGPAFYWTWPLMFFGQLCVALCFAELAAHYPLCGGVYPWARRVGSPFVGWMAGWVYLASLIVTLAAVALALQVTLPTIWPAARLFPEEARNAVVLGSLLIVFSIVVNSVGVRWLARINNLGVFAELFGVVLLIVLLAVHVRRGPGVLLDTQGRGVGQEGGYFGAFCAAAVMASYVMYGYDTAGTLAEETAEPRRRAPRAILQALTAAAVGGALLLMCALMSAGNLTDAELSSPDGGRTRRQAGDDLPRRRGVCDLRVRAGGPHRSGAAAVCHGARRQCTVLPETGAHFAAHQNADGGRAKRGRCGTAPATGEHQLRESDLGSGRRQHRLGEPGVSAGDAAAPRPPAEGLARAGEVRPGQAVWSRQMGRRGQRRGGALGIADGAQHGLAARVGLRRRVRAALCRDSVYRSSSDCRRRVL